MMKFRTLLNRLRRVITAERLIWSAALLVTAIAFLELGRSHPYPALYAPTDSLVIRDAAGQESTADLPAAPAAVSQPDAAGTTTASPAVGVTTTGTVSAPSVTERTIDTTAARTTVTKAPEEVAPGEKINLNTATKEQLMTIKGIGNTYAERIIAYRESHGGFSSLEQLKDIEGVADKRYEKWSPYLTVE